MISLFVINFFQSFPRFKNMFLLTFRDDDIEQNGGGFQRQESNTPDPAESAETDIPRLLF